MPSHSHVPPPTSCPSASVLRRAAVAGLCLAALPGCVVVEERAPVRYTGDPVTDGMAEAAASPVRDRVLWEYRVALAALRAGRFTEAKASLDDAIRRIGGIMSGNDEAAQRARGLFASEDIKSFIGEPYERVMAYYYRGLLYWRDGELDNARACFRSAQLADADAEVQANRGDYVLLDYLDGLASTKLAGDGADALARAAARSRQELPPYDPKANVILFAEFGAGPRKYAGGDYGEQLRFRTTDSRVRAAVLTVGGREVRFQPWDDLNFQATTRGGRVMDYVLGRKAVFKQGADAFGDVALMGAVIAANNIYQPVEKPADPKPEKPPTPPRDRRLGRKVPEKSPPEEPRAEAKQEDRKETAKAETPALEKDRDAENTAIALGVIGLVGKMVAAATIPQADTRTWDNLPQYLSFAALSLPEGEHPAVLDFFDASGRKIETLSRNLTIKVGDSSRDTVVFLSEHKF